MKTKVMALWLLNLYDRFVNRAILPLAAGSVWAGIIAAITPYVTNPSGHLTGKLYWVLAGILTITTKILLVVGHNKDSGKNLRWVYLMSACFMVGIAGLPYVPGWYAATLFIILFLHFSFSREEGT